MLEILSYLPRKSDGQTVKPCSGISFPCLISANRFSTTKVVNAFWSRLSSKSSEISSSVEEIRSIVCIVNLISRIVCAGHTPSEPWRILSPVACSPGSCLTSTSQFSMKSLTSLILAIASVGWNFFFWSFSSSTPEHQQAAWLSDHSQLTNSYTKKEYSVKFCTHLSRLLQLSITTLCLSLNPCSCQALNSIFCQRKCFHSLWRNVNKTRHAWL